MTTPVLVVFAVGLGIAGACDLKSRRLPNPVVLALLVAGLVMRASSAGPAALGAGVAGTLIGAALLSLPFALHWIGGGDVKLLAAAGMWLGPARTLEAALVGLALGGFLALLIALKHQTLRREVATNLLLAASGAAIRPERRARAQTVPLGAALAAGALAVALFERGLPYA
ncbi:MAG TPA: A24 family peptidase [Polyangia bacterium]|nr:A24 family peptidase [Polyangia bacterium]